MRWLALCIGAALPCFARTALDIMIPAAPVAGVLAGYALFNAATSLVACAAVERCGGTIDISDRYGRGTPLSIELPLYQGRKQKKERGR